MSRTRVDMVVFDWGGVILRHCRSFPEACERAGLPVRGDVDAEASRARRRPITAAYQRGQISTPAFYDALRDALDGTYTTDELRAIHHAWLIDEYEGVGEVIGAIHARGIATALLSNTNACHWARHLAKACGGGPDYPTAAMLTHRHASHLLGHAKPDADIYHAFVREVGVRPGSLLFFDDLDDNINTARALGWRAQRIDHTGDTASQMRAHLRAHGVL